jgi:membrane associated rhomboid family serine protease
MIPLRDNKLQTSRPWVTWTIVALNVFIYLWDRKFRVFGPDVVFADLSMLPSMVMDSFRSPDKFPVVTVFTSMWLHANIMHIIGNMVFLFVFGTAIEDALGSPRFALYYLFWGLVAAAAHILVDPSSSIPTLGASGAIGGVLGCYFLLFPANKIEFFIPPFVFFPLVVSAWVMLGLWFLYQVFIPQDGVANWAHAGGFLAGMLTVMVLGGRRGVLKDRPDLTDPEFVP